MPSPVLAPGNAVIAGPSSAILSLGGLSVARDGTGGLVYLEDVGGTAHVFVSVLAGGTFQAPVEVDAGLLAASSQPVIAAGNAGALEIGFINGGNLYAVDTTGAGAPFGAPQLLYAGAANPSISMSNFGKAYLAFTATNGAGGGDVRTAYYYAGQWALEPTALDENPSDAAGVGTGRPQVATAGDGTAIVAWGEGGHIYTRRVVKTTPSVAVYQADVPSVDGWSEVSAGDPEISTGGDSSYAAVAFQETIANGSTQQSRVLVNRLQAGQYDGVSEADGATTGGPEGADQPQTSDNEYGDGWVVSEHNSSHELFAEPLGTNDSPEAPERVDSLTNATAPDAVSSNAGLISTFIAWQQSPGTEGPAEIRLRYAPDGDDLGPEELISNPALGAADAAQGLGAAGDSNGDAAVAWVQGSGTSTRIVTAQLYQPPGGFVASNSFRYAATARPTLMWSPANEDWGAPTYTVEVDGVAVGTTTATELTLPRALTNGRHTYQVVAGDQGGAATAAKTATVFVDTVAPRVSEKLTGTHAVGYTQHIDVTATDLPPRGLPRSAASGVATVYVKWGDGSETKLRGHTATHVYRRKRTYTVTIIATDKAGNVRKVTKKLKITAHPVSTRPAKKKSKHATRAAATPVLGARLSFPRPGGDR